ncbi:MAG: hypothetical protein DWQ36_07035 [Acidobacteria bacterium]|nr:MAG: hypothetical protein DWQ30_24470 [Acidobacteriota bacterium]REK09296.1 MAG: hypothetical protein DWQ36_07035 [Acidobacteriota bacterium]
MHRTALALNAAALLLAAPVSANLLGNADFTDSLSGWTIEGGAWNHDATGGTPTPSGSARTNLVSGTTSSLTQCAPLDAEAGSGLALRAWVRSTGSATSRIAVELYSSADCSGDAGAGSALQQQPEVGWGLTYTTVGVPAGGAASALVRLELEGDGGQAWVDAASLDPDLAANGHFTENLAGWSLEIGSWTRVEDGLSEPLGSGRAVGAMEGALISRCVVLAAHPLSAAYLISGRFNHQDDFGNGVVTLLFYEGLNCDGNNLGTRSLVGGAGQLGTWESFSNLDLSPPLHGAEPTPRGARSVSVVVWFPLLFAGDVVYVDDVSVVPGPLLFLDGFESGDTGSWSASVP